MSFSPPPVAPVTPKGPRAVKPPFTPTMADSSILALGLQGMNPKKQAYNSTGFRSSPFNRTRRGPWQRKQSLIGGTSPPTANTPALYEGAGSSLIGS